MFVFFVENQIKHLKKIKFVNDIGELHISFFRCLVFLVLIIFD